MTALSIRSNEVVRKAIHLSSAAIPLLYWHLFDKDTMLKGLLFISTGFLLAEYLRLRFDWAKKAFMLVFGPAIRAHEQQQLTGATFVFTGAVISIFLFPKTMAVAALLILSISDTLAALIGIPFGRHHFFRKSVEGSLAFLISSLLILFYFYPQAVFQNLIISLIVTLAEANPINLDDNFLIPILTGSLLFLSSMV
ncbi:MAG: phosphatidate cytidylyltransferase [Candidatus Marinimicrobia bacterium]|nr:phosphatidate cytidylyltransferase [Candidatus Neomarinimicrobiota bacterium]